MIDVNKQQMITVFVNYSIQNLKYMLKFPCSPLQNANKKIFFKCQIKMFLFSTNFCLFPSMHAIPLESRKEIHQSERNILFLLSIYRILLLSIAQITFLL